MTRTTKSRDQTSSRATADEKRSGWIDPHDLALVLEIPCDDGPAAEAIAQAGMVEQVAWMVRPAVTAEIS